jgi:hypothetical protein
VNIITTGILGIFLVLAISAGLTTVFTGVKDTNFYVNWVGTFFMCGTPFQVMMAVVWGHKVPVFVNKLAQPLKGIVLTGMFVLAGAIITPILFFTVGQGVMSPILIHYTIQSVGVSLLVIIVFGCWPINKLTTNSLLLGLGTLVYCYVLNYILFKLFYNYSFMAGAPFYTEALEPGGLFNGITALTFAVTVAAMVMVLIMFEMWPVLKIVKSGKQPLLGLVGTVFLFLISAVIYYFFVGIIGMEPMDFMVQGPVCIIFGAFLVDNMMQFQLFVNLQQPLKGVAKLVICLIGALIMYQLYEGVLSLFVGSELPAGPATGYAKEAWIGTAMLGITFPVINIIAGAFEFWPIKRTDNKDASAQTVE